MSQFVHIQGVQGGEMWFLSLCKSKCTPGKSCQDLAPHLCDGRMSHTAVTAVERTSNTCTAWRATRPVEIQTMGTHVEGCVVACSPPPPRAIPCPTMGTVRKPCSRRVRPRRWRVVWTVLFSTRAAWPKMVWVFVDLSDRDVRTCEQHLRFTAVPMVCSAFPSHECGHRCGVQQPGVPP
jgi:hypothetical protein